MFFNTYPIRLVNKFLPSSLGISYNRPKLLPCAKWNPDAITLADSSTMVQTSSGLFVDTNNTVYATAYGLHSILVWPEGSVTPTRSVFSDLNSTHSIFATTNGDIYAENGYFNSRVEKWTANSSNSTTAIYVMGRCGCIFVDVYGNVYCSLTDFHRISRSKSQSADNSSVTVAGTGIAGFGPDLLFNPFGIIVNLDLSFYVADYGNHRIQLFQHGQLNGTTVVGNGASGTITLYYPIGIALDADGYLFIANKWLYGIIGSGPYGFRCIAGCTGTSGSGANQLVNPFSLSFDSYGNLYVTDAANNRIQKFLLATNSCSKSFWSAFPESM